MCWDGSTVKPDPEKDCQTPPCPLAEPCCDPSEELECEEEYVFCCDDGSWICANDEGMYRCGDETTEIPPNGKICDKPVSETKTKCCDPTVPSTIRCGFGGPFCCEDGSWTCASENDTYTCGDLELEKPPDGDVCDLVPVSPGCPDMLQMCPDGTTIQPDPNNNCQLPKCPEKCLSDTRTCADGTVLKRDPDNECAMPPCPKDIETCLQDDSPMTCPDGSEVYRDPENDCEFFPCLEFSCCDPNSEYGSIGNPAMCFEGTFSRLLYCISPRDFCSPRVLYTLVCLGHVCCPDGTWTCGNGDGSFSCGGEVRVGPFPEACPCCDTLEEPNCEKAACCDDGSWSCPTEDGEYKCGDELLSNSPSGILCATAATTEPIGCPEDLKICPDGSQLQRDPLNDCQFPECSKTKCCDPTDATHNEMWLWRAITVARMGRGHVPLKNKYIHMWRFGARETS